MEARKFRVGVLMIGSLYWDEKPPRPKWRSGRLSMDDKQYVKAPIRYGRLSVSWENSYTMVFYAGRSDEQLGQAIVVPCAQDVITGQDLIKEAVCLWNAEARNHKIQNNSVTSKNWGCVTLLKNPARSMSDDLLDCWAKHVSKEEESDYRKNIISAYCNEDVLSQCGFLKIPWPKADDGSELDFDALLATVTRPKPDKGRYPSAQDVAEAAYESGKGRTYYWRNRKHGIETFQDAEIEYWLAKIDDKRAQIQDS